MRSILALLIVVSAFTSGFAQGRVITGTVTDAADKQPIPGVNIIVDGTTKGSATGIDGTYQIELTNDDKSLSFTFVGYKTVSIPIGTNTILDVALEADTKTLNEVVVV